MSDGDIQCWEEVPSIAHFCSLFCRAFRLPEFEIQDLEESLLLSGDDEDLVIDLLLRLLKGCSRSLARSVNSQNYNEYLKQFFRLKTEDDSGFDFRCDEFLENGVRFIDCSLRNRVRILRQLCEFRLDSEDVSEKVKNLDAASLRVEPLGFDSEGSTYWYFYGTRLYKEKPLSEEMKKKRRNKKKRKKEKKERKKKKKKRSTDSTSEDESGEVSLNTWSVVCVTREDWEELTEKMKKSKKKEDRYLYLTLSESFLPEILKMFIEKEKEERKKLRLAMPKRTSSRLEQKKRENADVLDALSGDSEKEDEDSFDEEKIKEVLNYRETGVRITRKREKEVKRALKKVSSVEVKRPKFDSDDDVESEDDNNKDSENSEKNSPLSQSPVPSIYDDDEADDSSSPKSTKTSFSNALLKIGTKSTKDSTLAEKPARKSPGVLLQTAGLLKSGSKPEISGSSSSPEEEPKISFGLYGGHLAVDGYNRSSSDYMNSNSDNNFNFGASSSNETKPKTQVFSNWGGDFFQKNLDFRANTNKILKKMNLNLGNENQQQIKKDLLKKPVKPNILGSSSSSSSS